MHRRSFLSLAASAPLFGTERDLPVYKIVTRAKPSPNPSIPGPYPGKAIRVHSDDAVDTAKNQVNAEPVRTMLSAGIRALTGTQTDKEAWSKFISADDIVGIKVNCSGAPEIYSNPELVSAIIDSLLTIGVAAPNIYIYDRFENQMKIANFTAKVAKGVQTFAAETSRGSILGYDPFTYVEVSFFGEEDTRSNLILPVADKFTKVINVPTMKEHRAAGVTGCLKNMAYGDFSNVARSHQREKSNTYSFIGTLASVEPLRSKTVLHVMDGLRSLWQGGPFLQSPRFLFFPKRIVVGTDPVALDHTLIDMIEKKRREEGAPSIFDRSRQHVKFQPELDPNFNSFIREPGHVQFASHLGLGIYDNVQEKVINV